MGMFNWQDGTTVSNATQTSIVSSRFYIYWATAIPLTILTLCGWALWWRIEKRSFDIDLMESLEGAEAINKSSRSRILKDGGKQLPGFTI
jgi:hypothetical protein